MKAYNIIRRTVLFVIVLLFAPAVIQRSLAQDNDTAQGNYYVDDEGVLRKRESGAEVALFGVNYDAPFAHTYRAMERLGKDHKKQIDNDIYHFARLGFDAFRLHIWDTEISDSLGNLVNNEHLQLLDYMLWKLKEHHIKVILTPLTFYNNAYPDGPTPTDGFANYISKGEAPGNKEFWPVIKRYLDQFINHVNPHTGLAYKYDPNIIATEIINEPSHGGNLSSITNFIDEMADRLRESGWEKPIFYNISQNPGVTEAVMNADIDGTSFQWYPAGLVGGKAIKKNYLPYVDQYNIPFSDDERFKTKAQMVYEFDSADVLYSYAYPVMARSFREAGFQFAAQFAYDPLAIAYANTDYQTHYLNLAYIPSKAISMKIASEVFHRVPRHKSFGQYPENTTFGNFRVSHKENLSEMNADSAFYYSNSTNTKPKRPEALEHVAGVGSSPVVSYQGTGAYFLDKLEDGIWRLEVMSDAIQVRDVFERPNFDKYVTRIEWNGHTIRVDLPNLGSQYSIRGLNDGNKMDSRTTDGGFTVAPGSYLLVREGKDSSQWSADSRMGMIRIGEYVAPEPSPGGPVVFHQPVNSLVTGKPVAVMAKAAGLAPSDTLFVTMGSGWRSRRFPMKEIFTGQYKVEIPAGQINPGILHYWIVVDREGKENITFPGGHSGAPSDWDYYYDESWEVPVVEPGSPLLLFDAKADYSDIDYSFSFWNRGYRQQLISTETPGKMAVQSHAEELQPDGPVLGWSVFVGDKLRGRQQQFDQSDQLVIKAISETGDKPLKVILVGKRGSAYSTTVTPSTKLQEYRIPLNKLQPDAFMLLPRSYPPFHPFWFKASEITPLNPDDIEQIQFILQAGKQGGKSGGFQVESAWLEKRK